MQLETIGLGRMGANLVRRLTDDGRTCVVYDVNPGAVTALSGKGIEGASSIGDLVAKLTKPALQYADRLLSAMRKQFGGHDEKPAEKAAG